MEPFMAMILKRPVHPTEQPSDTERHGRSGVRLSLNCVPQPTVKRRRGLPGCVSGLAVEILRSAGCLVDHALSFCPDVAGGATDALLHFPADVAGCSFETILIHGRPPSGGTRGVHERSRAADKQTVASDCAMTIVKTTMVDMSFDMRLMTR
jgi:hypothetical protein